MAIWCWRLGCKRTLKIKVKGGSGVVLTIAQPPFFSLSSYGEDMHERFLVIHLRLRGGGNFIIVEEAEALTGEDEEEAGYSLPGCKFLNPS